MSDEATTVLLLLGLFVTFVLSLIVVFFWGRDYEIVKRARRDLRDTEQMRAAIREYDARVSEFVDPPSLAAQSIPQVVREVMAGAVTTKSLPLPPSPGA